MVIVAILDLLVLYEVVMTWCRGRWRCPGAKDGGFGKSPLQKSFVHVMFIVMRADVLGTRPY